jgi:hypothetical protein
MESLSHEDSLVNGAASAEASSVPTSPYSVGHDVYLDLNAVSQQGGVPVADPGQAGHDSPGFSRFDSNGTMSTFNAGPAASTLNQNSSLNPTVPAFGPGVSHFDLAAPCIPPAWLNASACGFGSYPAPPFGVSGNVLADQMLVHPPYTSDPWVEWGSPPALAGSVVPPIEERLYQALGSAAPQESEPFGETASALEPLRHELEAEISE